MKIVVIGGAGYIGSHVVLAALDCGYDVTVFDDFSNSFKTNVNPNARVKIGSTKSKKDLSRLFDKNHFDGVIHLAANKASAESMINPVKYSNNNIIGSLNLLNKCVEYKIKYFIFSSSAAVYGNPRYNPIDESHPTNPSSYYGYTKLLIEKTLKWYSEIYDLNYVSLRYFNAAGYDVNKRVAGKEKNTENLIPQIMEVARRNKSFVSIFGNDYPTKDGTGIRDYVHVSDLATAHVSAIENIRKYSKNLILNLGSETGFSVFEILEKTKSILNIDIPYKIRKRRIGDVAKIVSSCSKAEDILNWEKKHSSLEDLIKSTWDAFK